jgi:hypothetical protein
VNAPERAARDAACSLVNIPPLPKLPAPLAMAFQRRIAGPTFTDEPGVWKFTRIFIIESLLVGEDHVQLCLHQIRHQRAQRIVIAKADFLEGHRVVFIDDRHHPQPQQVRNVLRILR